MFANCQSQVGRLKCKNPHFEMSEIHVVARFHVCHLISVHLLNDMPFQDHRSFLTAIARFETQTEKNRMEETANGDARERVEHPSRGLDAPGANVGSGRNNVVVKVGMVGDAQVGKTSLMVKYVEGKFDEDYIHTLGMAAATRASGGSARAGSSTGTNAVHRYRREFHGKDDCAAQHGDHVQYLGSWW